MEKRNVSLDGRTGEIKSRILEERTGHAAEDGP